MTKRKREFLIFTGISLGSLFFLAWVIPNYTPAYPGYGVSAALLPNVAVGIILALSVLSLVRLLLDVRSQRVKGILQSEEIKEVDRVHLLHLASFMVPCILLMPAMKWIGFLPAGILFMLLIQFLCGQRKLVAAVLTSVGTVGIIYLAMVYGLGVPLP